MSLIVVHVVAQDRFLKQQEKADGLPSGIFVCKKHYPYRYMLLFYVTEKKMNGKK